MWPPASKGFKNAEMCRPMMLMPCLMPLACCEADRQVTSASKCTWGWLHVAVASATGLEQVMLICDTQLSMVKACSRQHDFTIFGQQSPCCWAHLSHRPGSCC